MAAILYVRLKSDLSEDKLKEKVEERKPEFLDVPGLAQKFYGKDPQTGYACGIYLFESEEALNNFAQSDLAKTIPQAYEVSEIRKEVYQYMFALKPESSPLGK